MLPLLDVVFLLLAVFLLSVVRMVRSYAVPVDLPAMATGVQADVPAVLLLGVDAQGRLFAAGEETTLAGLRERLRASLSADPELQVLLQADREARHGDVAELLDAVRAEGAGQVLLVAEPAPLSGGDG
ncbi:biopolymer transport protein ExbD [Planctomycetes bacterium Pla86]|uniref:Biopolymer transport protein ExbD n=2 Tax=Engelhardtia mirabilis TaxID=2528011 RepID=A0A518BNM7_9BACT|nr:biopolymer transport protein ExbD [Planctomycetes bacterium Pla133]QDV02892.1 biopolymer transport protein ExbD [Planctomycetes bacterium Pla86]